MTMKDFKEELSDEVAAILKLDINVTQTKAVPHSGDSAITFPNLDAGTQGCKLIDTCVLYVDIRRSTELNLSHRPQTVARLYSAFVRAMTRCARKNGGHVRGIIGDRLMVIFDCENAYVNAVETAVAMNSVANYVINRHFRANEIACGIGLDAGRMLATKTGIRRHGAEQHNYRNLVWLGRPANVASKLTDIANKPEETVTIQVANVMRSNNNLSIPQWQIEYSWDFIRGLSHTLLGGWSHHDRSICGFQVVDRSFSTRSATPAILMTQAVYDGFRMAAPHDESIVNNWFAQVSVSVSGYNGIVYGGNVTYKAFA